MKIIVDSDIPYIKGVMEPYARINYIKGDAISKSDIADVDAMIIRTRTRCDSALLAGSKIKMIATATIGSDHIDTEYCRSAGITVVTAAGSNSRGVLQWVAAALAYASSEQKWRPEEKTIGIVGIGNIGSLVAQYTALWGFRVLCCDPPKSNAGGMPPVKGVYESIETLAKESDIITFHVPLVIDEPYPTYHLAGGNFIKRIRNGALIINSSRGEVADTTELLYAIEKKHCECVIDTWEHEPDINRLLLQRSLLGTPHIAGYSSQGKANASSIAVRAIASKFNLPLTEWYPFDKVPKVSPKAITWEELKNSLNYYCDIASDSQRLKGNPKDFECFRNNYRYRTEYF